MRTTIIAIIGLALLASLAIITGGATPLPDGWKLIVKLGYDDSEPVGIYPTLGACLARGKQARAFEKRMYLDPPQTVEVSVLYLCVPLKGATKVY